MDRKKFQGPSAGGCKRALAAFTFATVPYKLCCKSTAPDNALAADHRRLPRQTTANCTWETSGANRRTRSNPSLRARAAVKGIARRCAARHRHRTIPPAPQSLSPTPSIWPNDNPRCARSNARTMIVADAHIRVPVEKPKEGQEFSPCTPYTARSVTKGSATSVASKTLANSGNR
jgi:hypothetical protein